MQKLLTSNHPKLKSYQFINALTRTPLRSDSGADNLTSGTSSVLRRMVEHDDGRQLIFLDTPGFDSIHFRDVEILMLVDEWLKTKYVVIHYCRDLGRSH